MKIKVYIPINPEFYLCPFLAALCKAVLPFSSRELIFLVFFASTSTCLVDPISAARCRGVL